LQDILEYLNSGETGDLQTHRLLLALGEAVNNLRKHRHNLSALLEKAKEILATAEKSGFKKDPNLKRIADYVEQLERYVVAQHLS